MDTKVTKVFNGIFTITNPATGQHRTFKIHTKDFSKAKDKSDLKRVVSVLRGADNTSDYTGFAFIGDDGIKVWKRFRSSTIEARGGEPSYHQKLAKTLWGVITGKLDLPFEESKHCQRCDRLLTHPESLTTGFGPECVKKVGGGA